MGIRKGGAAIYDKNERTLSFCFVLFCKIRLYCYTTNEILLIRLSHHTTTINTFMKRPPRAIWFIAEVRSHQDLRQQEDR
jgi:hypothetical protein